MVPSGSWSLLAGIRLTQCGDPLAHRQEDFLHSASSHRFVGAARQALSLAQTKDEEIAQAGFLQWDVAEGRMVTKFAAELGPAFEGVVSLGLSLVDKSGVCCLQRSAEVRSEAIAGLSCRCSQG